MLNLFTQASDNFDNSVYTMCNKKLYSITYIIYET